MFEPSHNRRDPAVLVPKEEVGRWTRWRADSLELAAPAAKAPKPVAPEPTEEELAARRQQELAAIREAARKAGHAEGLAQGRAEGFEQGKAEGLEAGRLEGHAEGLQAGQQEARAEAEALNALGQSCAVAIEGLGTGVSTALAALALDVARKVIGTELKANPDSVAAVVQEVLRTDLAEHGPVQLWLHPDDAALVGGYLGDALAENKWRIMSDASLARGGCRAQSAYGDIDATLQTRWQQVVATLGSTAPWHS
jgi:flagellar assembly protein FliH